MWDIPSGTGLAIHIDALPTEAPQAALRALPLAAQSAFQQQGSVAVIDISGVITPYSNILSALFGGTDVQSISDQFEDAVNDPSVEGIVLRIDSPGGIITGVEELASTIAAARGTKPIIAYAYGNAASAAYWIASAADKIVAGPTTSLGSIGVAMAVAKDQDKGWVRFVSSNAPGKMLNPESKEGQDSVQRRLDAMEAEFVGAIAAHRGISTEKVLSEFGRGDVLPAREAVRVGMADMVGGFRDALALMFDPDIQPKPQGDTMDKQANAAAPTGDAETIRRDQVTAEFLMREFPQIAGVLIREGREQSQDTIKTQAYEEGMQAGAKVERERIMALEEMALSGHEDMVAEAKKDGKTQPGELAMKIVAAQKQRRFDFLQDRREDANANKGIGPSQDQQSSNMDASAPIEERAAAEWAKDQKIRTEFGDKDTYIAFRKAEDEGRVRRFAAK